MIERTRRGARSAIESATPPPMLNPTTWHVVDPEAVEQLEHVAGVCPERVVRNLALGRAESGRSGTITRWCFAELRHDGREVVLAARAAVKEDDDRRAGIVRRAGAVHRRAGSCRSRIRSPSTAGT